MCKDLDFHERSKHIDVRYHFIGEKVAEGKIDMVKVPTEDNPSDMDTKVLPTAKFKYYLELCTLKKPLSSLLH